MLGDDYSHHLYVVISKTSNINRYNGVPLHDIVSLEYLGIRSHLGLPFTFIAGLVHNILALNF